MPKAPSTAKVGFSKLRFNSKTQRYYLPKSEGGNGRFWSESTVRDIVDRDIESRAQRMKRLGEKCEKLGERFKAGDITKAQLFKGLDAIEAQHLKEVSAVHLTNVAAASGGFHNMESADFGRAGGFSAYHRNKAREMIQEFKDDPDILTGDAAGKMKPSDRFGMYSEAGRASFERTADLKNSEAGFNFVENVEELAAHHCKGEDSCPAQTALGRIRYDDARRKVPGYRKCVTKCKCKTKRFKAAA